jgi:predicted RNA methylase
MTDADRYETPPELVAKMICCVPDIRYQLIADFSVGDGTLLAAAAEKWPSSLLLGTDVDRRAVSRLRRKYPNWIVSRCDFLRRESRDRCQALRRFSSRLSLILLNPPFSGKGGTRWNCALHGKDFDCSQALAFALTSLSFLDSGGHLVAILPRAV